MFSVLIVEDNPVDAKIATFVLERRNYHIHLAKNSHEAFEILEKFQINLILLDWLLPQVSGMDILKTIRKNPSHKTTPIIIVSGKNETKDVQRAVETGASDYVVKPIDPLILDSKLDRLLKKEIDWISTPLKDDPKNEAQITLKAKVTQISEVGVEFETESNLSIETSVHLTIGFLNELQIPFLIGKIFSNERRENKNYYRCSILGMKESDLKKIRLYIRTALSQNKTA